MDGILYNDGILATEWNGAGGGNPYIGITPITTNWSMVAWVTTPSNSTMFLCYTNGIVTNSQTPVLPYQSWGQSLTIGGDPLYSPTNHFNGNICDVTVFTTNLSLNQIAYLYYAGLASEQLNPIISGEPVSTGVYQGRPVSLSVTASGVSALTYQWQTNSASGFHNVTGATGTILTFPSATQANAGTYRVIVTDTSGSTTSSVATLVVPLPANVESPYDEYLTTNFNPLAYYKLDENPGTAIAYDYWGGLSGTYGTKVSVGSVEAPDSADIFPSAPPGDGFLAFEIGPEFTNAYAENLGAPAEAALAMNSEITIPPLNVNSNAASILMWIYPSTNQVYTNGLLYCRGNGTVAGIGFGNGTNGALGYNWNNVGGTYGWASGLVPLATNWNFVGLVITPSNATMYCYYTNPATRTVSWGSAVNTAVTNAPQAFGYYSTIANDEYNDLGERQFDGAISDVAIFNQALTSTEINNLFYNATGYAAPAVITSAPASVGATSFLVNQGGTEAVPGCGCQRASELQVD